MDEQHFSRLLGYSFTTPELLRRALTHRSYSAQHYERLEYLGDSVLNCIIALELFHRFPRLSEGELSRVRANLVNQESLCMVAQQFSFGEALRLGEGELKSGGLQRPSILADAVEAVVGAVFLDGGFDAAAAVVRMLFAAPLAAVDAHSAAKDPKTRLQEYLQGRRLGLPQYGVVATHGRAHQHVFQVECVIPELNIRSLGEGSSRRSAEQDAAQRAYEIATRQ